MEETLILVNQDDFPTGFAEKLFVHQEGLLHRAFSIFIFDQQGRLLLQQRALTKYHSQGLWTNTCCGHPRQGEEISSAARRRLREEMGIECELTAVARLLYHEQVSNQMIEHEYDHVFAGVYCQDPLANPDEAHAWQWQSLHELSQHIRIAPHTFSVWFRRILERHTIAGLLGWYVQAQGSLFESWKSTTVQQTDQALEQQLPSSDLPPPKLHEAMRYAIQGGDKRMRPLLCHAAGTVVDADPMVSAALEMMHVYSLVHDDLPAMDNDDLRRGRATVHKQFDEATAILVGDALQSQAFITLCHLPVSSRCKALLTGELARAVGSQGMAGSQMIDLISTGTALNCTQLQQMHRMKTGALIQACIRMGVLCADDPTFDLKILDRYSAAVGLAFQVVDDILDATMDTATLGKTAGKDARDQKATYTSIMGPAPAMHLAQQLVEKAHQALAPMGASAVWLHNLADLIIKRTN